MNRLMNRNRSSICLMILAMVCLSPLLPLANELGAQTTLLRGKLRPKMITPTAEKTIQKALAYLAKAQGKDGCWDDSGQGSSYPMAMTSLAGVGFLAGGNTPESGKYSRNVRRAMNYVLNVAEQNWKAGDKACLISGKGNEMRSMYGHGFAMLFLAQCYGMEGNKESKRGKRIKRVLDGAVQLTVQSQSDIGAAKKHAGGWTYSATSKSDEASVTVTQLQALRACRNVGIKVPKKAIDRAVLLLIYLQQRDGGISYSSRSRGSSMPSLSAAAMVSFYMAGIYDDRTGGAGAEAKMVEKLAVYCNKRCQPTNSSGHFFYTQLYMAQAMYQRSGADWEKYFPVIRERLIKMQGRNGEWNGDSIGRIYGTSIALIILQLPYGYLPIAQR